MTERQGLFDDWASTYDDSLREEDGFPFEGYQQCLNLLLELAGREPGKSVLDLGTGTGAIAGMFDAVGHEVTGVDFSEKMLEVARRRVPGGTYLRHDVLGDWPLELTGREFDLVVSSYLLHEFPDETKLGLLAHLRENALAQCGRILVADIAFPDAPARDRAHREWEDRWDDHEYYWTWDQLAPKLASAGFEVAWHQVSFCSGVIELVDKSSVSDS